MRRDPRVLNLAVTGTSGQETSRPDSTPSNRSESQVTGDQGGRHPLLDPDNPTTKTAGMIVGTVLLVVLITISLNNLFDYNATASPWWRIALVAIPTLVLFLWLSKKTDIQPLEAIAKWLLVGSFLMLVFSGVSSKIQAWRGASNIYSTSTSESSTTPKTPRATPPREYGEEGDYALDVSHGVSDWVMVKEGFVYSLSGDGEVQPFYTGGHVPFWQAESLPKPGETFRVHTTNGQNVVLRVRVKGA